MPLYDFQCQGCGFIEEFIVHAGISQLNETCPLRCLNPLWKRVLEPSLPAENLRNKIAKGRFPHLSHMREPCVVMTPEGPEIGSRRVVVKSLNHQEAMMKKLGYEYYEEPSDPMNAKKPEMPPEIKRLEEENPMVRKYLDMKRAGRIPKAMVLSEDELQERFHVPADP